jgi:phosphoserine phosphatase RsbU/P
MASTPALKSASGCRICQNQQHEAQLIQSVLLPTGVLKHELIEIGYRYAPYEEVGGDFADFFRLPDGLVGLYLGDVVGKGLAGAMYASLAMGMMRGIHKTGTDAASVLEKHARSVRASGPHTRA